MGLETLLRGLVIGFSIAAPVGPIGVLCIRRTLADGRVTGLAVGLGAAAADAVYGAVAGFGLTAVSGLLVRQQGAPAPRRRAVPLLPRHSHLPGAPADHAARAGGTGLLGAFAATFGLTLANPATILSFVAVFAGLGIAGAGSWREATVLVAGVFLGSALWWLMLSGLVSALRVAPGSSALFAGSTECRGWSSWPSGWPRSPGDDRQPGRGAGRGPLTGRCSAPYRSGMSGTGFEELSRAHERTKADLARATRELRELIGIGIRLAAERDTDALLDLILTTAREHHLERRRLPLPGRHRRDRHALSPVRARPERQPLGGRQGARDPDRPPERARLRRAERRGHQPRRRLRPASGVAVHDRPRPWTSRPATARSRCSWCR